MSNLVKFPKNILKTNVVYCADNLEVMKQLPSESIDLIYIDPPFGKNAVRKSRAWDSQVQGLSFYESWGNGIYSYVAFMRDRLEQMHRLLKPTGSIYVHLDWKSVHYIKVEMDKIFGESNFKNEIIWHYRSGNIAKNNFMRKHDNILLYSKNKKLSKFNMQYRKEYYKALYPTKKLSFKGANDSEDKHGKYRTSQIDSVWEIPHVFTLGKEHLPYPTQKPLALLERIIKASSNENDVVADFFCGCATTLSAAQSLGRNWIGVDASKDASIVIRKRMLRDHNLKIEITPLKNLTMEQAKALDPFEFEKYCVRCIGGIPNEKQRGDGGIDGTLIEDGTPIQVKKSENIGRPVIDSFYKHLKKNGRGIIIALSFGSGAKEEAMKLKLEGYDLQLWTLKNILQEGTNLKTSKIPTPKKPA